MSSEAIAESASLALDPYEAELSAFCAAEYPRLVRAMDLYCGDRAVAEDLAQEALVRACQRWARVRMLDAPGGWTFRVAVNLANSFLRRRGAELRANRRSVPATTTTEPLHLAADRLALRDALGGLASKQREAIVLRYFLDYSAEEAAALMGVPSSTVRSHTRRALAAMRRQLDDPRIVEEVE